MIVFMSIGFNLQLKRFCESGVETVPTYIKRGQKVMEHIRCDVCSHFDRFCSNIFYILRKAVLHFYILSYLNPETMSITDMCVIA